MSVVVPVGTHRVTVSDDGSRVCTCGTPEWCHHILAVVSGDATKVLPSDLGLLHAAQNLVEQHVDVIAVLTARLDQVRNDSTKAGEVAALEYAIAHRLNRQSR